MSCMQWRKQCAQWHLNKQNRTWYSVQFWRSYKVLLASMKSSENPHTPHLQRSLNWNARNLYSNYSTFNGVQKRLLCNILHPKKEMDGIFHCKLHLLLTKTKITNVTSTPEFKWKFALPRSLQCSLSATGNPCTPHLQRTHWSNARDLLNIFRTIKGIQKQLICNNLLLRKVGTEIFIANFTYYGRRPQSQTQPVHKNSSGNLDYLRSHNGVRGGFRNDLGINSWWNWSEPNPTTTSTVSEFFKRWQSTQTKRIKSVDNFLYWRAT